MTLRFTLLAGACALFPTLASAQMMVEDAYARAASPVAQSGAAFMAIHNDTDRDDRVLSARSDIAERVELHTHLDDNGVMRMMEMGEGIPLPAGEVTRLERGGMHVMFLGLRQSLDHGEEIEVTLTFEHAEPVTVTVPVDLERQPGQSGMQHGSPGHGG